MLDSSRVFTEIMSSIKGGQKSVDLAEGKLTRSDYLSMSENRASSLSKQKREFIYDIYQNYEKIKTHEGDFDMADIVADLHRRLRIDKYEGDDIHFVYIDEVQDLTMSQIALLKHVCQNVEAGFVFCGDTAQTIARGIDFRFEDIKSLFYNKFMPESETSAYNQGKVKANVSETFVLNQNFRTHCGVLKLSQSTIELLSSYFPHSIDVLKPETSLVYGEAPVVLDCGSRKNAVVTIFGNTGHDGGKFVGFGAEQVILVRDDNARREILNSIGKQALVLTVLECKGLEFQDVLLYNFFGTSPMKSQWRVVYEYMDKQGLLEPNSKSYPSFKDSKHNILCSELKQLYVAITRTRQRLWICEETEEYCRPMFDFWKTKCLVQFKELDDTFAQTMKVASSPEEWKSRGKKLYYERNYEMATMCFENARDFYWEKMSKAAGLRATAKHLQDLNPKNAEANAIFREAAGIFESIGKTEFAAQCFSDSGDYEKAGKLYIEKGVESDLKRAGDCFYLAGSYEMALQAYTQGNFFSECLNVCEKGGLYDIGRDHFQRWKQNEGGDRNWVDVEQKFLENCARSCFDKKDMKSMMKCVRDFNSADFKRGFLRSLSLFDELLELEKESGNYREAVNIAKMMGNLLCEADLHEKLGDFREAYELVIVHVLSNSLWSGGSNGWPLKEFTKKAELLERAMTFAKKSCGFHERGYAEVCMLSNEHDKYIDLTAQLYVCNYHGNIRAQILCWRKMLDFHFRLNTTEFVWYDALNALSPTQMAKRNQFSVESLLHCWTSWKSMIVVILEYLSNFQLEEGHKDNIYVRSALNYLGVVKQCNNLGDKYLLLIPDAKWVKNLGDKFLKKNDRLFFVDVQPLVSFAQRYWSSELSYVGMHVLRTLDAALNMLSKRKAPSELWQIESLLQIYEVSKFLLKSDCFRHAHDKLRSLEIYNRKSIDNLGHYVIPLDWERSLEKDMVYQRTSEAWQDILKEAIYKNTKQEGRLTNSLVGRLIVMILGVNVKDELVVKIKRKFEPNIYWASFIENFWGNSYPSSLVEKNCIRSFYKALKNTYGVNSIEENDFVNPGCFMYLVERLLLWISCLTGYIYATKSAFTEWLVCQTHISFPGSVKQYRSLEVNSIFDFLANSLNDIVCDQGRIKTWIKSSKLNVKEYLPLFVLRVFVCLCLIHMISGAKEYLDILRNLLSRKEIVDQLPSEFCSALRMGERNMSMSVYAEAFELIDNPLMIAKIWKESSTKELPEAAKYVDLSGVKEKDIILEFLFPSTGYYTGTGIEDESSEED